MTDKPKRPQLRIGFKHPGITEHLLSDQARKEARQATIDMMMDDARELIAHG